MVDSATSILRLSPVQNWSDAVAANVSKTMLAADIGSRTGPEPRQNSEISVDTAGMERAYQRMLIAKDKLASSLQIPGDILAARELASQIARQVAAAAQEYVSLGGRSSALLEPSLPVTNNGKPVPLGDTGFKAYEAATQAVAAATTSEAPATTEATVPSAAKSAAPATPAPTTQATQSPSPAPITVSVPVPAAPPPPRIVASAPVSSSAPVSVPAAAPAPVAAPAPTAVPVFSSGVSIKV